MKEHIKLVTDFAELKQGDQILLMICAWCGCSHRCTLVSYAGDLVGLRKSGKLDHGPVWITDLQHKNLPLGIHVQVVANKIVYLILPGVDEETERERSMELEDA